MVREWVGSDGKTRPLGGIHPVALLSAWSAEGWELVNVTTYGTLRISTLRRPIAE